MIVTARGRWGGYGLYVLNATPVFTYNLLMLLQPRWADNQRLTAGRHKIVFDFNSFHYLRDRVFCKQASITKISQASIAVRSDIHLVGVGLVQAATVR